MSVPRLLAALGTVFAAASSQAAADPLAYVRASSQHQPDGDAARYHPLNLLDNDPATIWCEGSDALGEGEGVRVYFKAAQRIDKIVIVPAVGGGRVIEEIKLSDGTSSVRITVGQEYVAQPFRPAMRGGAYEISIVLVGAPNPDAALPNDVACLADVLLYDRDQLFGGKAPAKKLRYSPLRDRVLGRWSSAPLGASERFLVFAIDGTWEWRHVPLLGGRTRRQAGEYRFRGNRLLMRVGETGRWSDMSMRHAVVRVSPGDLAAPKGDYATLELNRLLGPEIGGIYNNAEF